MFHGESLASAVRDFLGQYPNQLSAQQWRVEEDSDSPWIWVTPDLADIPQQGWKLHLSATVASAVTVLGRALPVLLANGASFKVARSLAELQSLNEGRLGFSQVGKFITVYPNSDARAVWLATALDERLQGIPHPNIPSDRPLKPRGVVHYRYGSFGQRHVRTPIGQILPAIEMPDGVLVPDRRTVPYRQPDWVQDPFIASGVAAPLPVPCRFLADRYLIVHTLDESARGSVHLGADIIAGRRCVLKRAARDAQVDETGRGAADRLRHEAELLRRFAGTLPVPTVFDLIEDGEDVWLAMEDVKGEILSEYVQRLAGDGRLLSTAEVVAYGLELTSLLGAIHGQGVVYRDLKSDNVVVGMDRRLWLVDFEIAHDLSSQVLPDGRGTEGYMSPQAAEGEVATVLDDVYGLGAILYFLATAAEPSWAPADAELTRRPIHLLNPDISPRLVSIVDRCLAASAGSRFPSMAAVAEALERNQVSLDFRAAVHSKEQPDFESEAGARERARTFARRLGDSLCESARRDHLGIFWTSAHEEDSGSEQRYLAGGSAGVLLALAELVAEFGEGRHREALIEGIEWLENSKPVGTILPGLYVGELGVAAALLRAGQVLNRSDLVGKAGSIMHAVAALPHASPDIFHGTAGRLRFNLLLWQETQEAEHLAHAVEAGEFLLMRSDRLADGHARWIIPPGFEDLSGDAYLGYAHGAAGIGDALLDLFLATGDDRFLEASQAAGRWLLGKAVRRSDSGLNWPTLDAPADRPAGAFWCHGAAGIGRFFLNLSAAGVFPDAFETARDAARTVSASSRSVGPTQCHGIAGNIEFVLDMYQMTRSDGFLNDACCLARILETFSRERNGRLVWLSDAPRIITPDYMVGYAGVAVCFLRLGSPDDRPHQLSVRGFRWTSRSSSQRDVGTTKDAIRR
jgi:tRNA A-37 threonylcarbamoyl transferase component Bud32